MNVPLLNNWFLLCLPEGFLAVLDASTLGEFRKYAIQWQLSPACEVAGFFGVLSSELSVFTLGKLPSRHMRTICQQRITSALCLFFKAVLLEGRIGHFLSKKNTIQILIVNQNIIQLTPVLLLQRFCCQ